IILEQAAQSVTGRLLVVNDEDDWLDGIHESVSGRRCAIYSHSNATSLNEELQPILRFTETARFRDKPCRLDKAQACCGAIGPAKGSRSFLQFRARAARLRLLWQIFHFRRKRRTRYGESVDRRRIDHSPVQQAALLSRRCE